MNTTCAFRQRKDRPIPPKPPTLPAKRLHAGATRQDVLRHQRRQQRWAKSVIICPVVYVNYWDVYRKQKVL